MSYSLKRLVELTEQRQAGLQKQEFYTAIGSIEFEEVSKRKDGKKGRPKKREELITKY